MIKRGESEPMRLLPVLHQRDDSDGTYSTTFRGVLDEKERKLMINSDNVIALYYMRDKNRRVS